MTRRQFLFGVTLISTCFGVKFAFGQRWLDRLWTLPKFSINTSAIRQCLHQVFSDLESPSLLGKRYLDLYPQEAQRALLLAAHIQSVQPQTSSELKKMLAQQRELDFRNNRTVIIDGWLLAKTEVEACALTILL